MIFTRTRLISLPLAALALAAATVLADLPSAVTGVASSGLVTLATTGNPTPLHEELGGTVVDSKQLVAKIAAEKLGQFLDLEQKEHLAPMALITPDGDMFAMVAPTITKDNFILVTADGTARRMDVGNNEGHNQPSVVTEIVEDGGTPWYLELWYWLTGA